jgi:hypothetical protein
LYLAGKLNAQSLECNTSTKKIISWADFIGIISLHSVAGDCNECPEIIFENRSSTGSSPPRSRPLPQPHTSAAVVLVYELNARDFDRSCNLFCGVFAPTQFAIH